MPKAEGIQCPKCKVEMKDHQLPMDATGKFYPAKICPKCNGIMVPHATGNAMVKDIHKEGDVNETWANEVMARADATEEWPTKDNPYDKMRQILQNRVRMASKYILNSDKNCPRCGKDNLTILQERKIGKDMRCDDCDIQYFFVFPE